MTAPAAATTPAPTAPAAPVTELPAPGTQPGTTQPADYVDRLVARYGSERNALQIIGDDNFNLRERHRTDTTQLNALTAQLGEFQSLGLKPEELKVIAALGKKPEELKKIVEDHPVLLKKVADAEEQILMDEASKLLGYSKPKLLKKLSHDEEVGFTLEIATETVTTDGKQEVKRVPYVTGKAAGSAKMKLEDYANQHLTDYIPSLTADAESGNSTERGSEKIVPFPRQPTKTEKGKAPTAGQAALGYIESQYETPGQLAEKK